MFSPLACLLSLRDFCGSPVCCVQASQRFGALALTPLASIVRGPARVRKERDACLLPMRRAAKKLVTGKVCRAWRSHRESRGPGLAAKPARAAPHKGGTPSFMALVTFLF